MAFFRNLLPMTSANERSPSPSEKGTRTPTSALTWREEIDNVTASDVAAVELGLGVVLPPGRWYWNSRLRMLNFCIFSLTMFSTIVGFEASAIVGLLALPEFLQFLGNPGALALGAMVASYKLGMCLSYPLAAYTVNRFGRKRGIYVGYGILVLGAGLQMGTGGSPILYLVGRFLIGCASAWLNLSAAQLVAEIAYPTHRKVATALYNCAWCIGSLIAMFMVLGGLHHGQRGFMTPTYLQLLVPFLALPGAILAPQSPKWLATAGRWEEARQVFAKWHSGGDDQTALLEHQISSLRRALTRQRKASGFRAAFTGRRNHLRVFISVSLGIFAQWSGNGMLGAYLVLALKNFGYQAPLQLSEIGIGVQAYNLVCAVIAASIIGRVGARKLFLVSAATMLTCFVPIAVLAALHEANPSWRSLSYGAVPLIIGFFTGYSMALTPLIIAYPCDIWPQRLRSIGLSITLMTTTCAALFNNFISPLAITKLRWRMYIVYIGFQVAFGLTAFFFYKEIRLPARGGGEYEPEEGPAQSPVLGSEQSGSAYGRSDASGSVVEDHGRGAGSGEAPGEPAGEGRGVVSGRARRGSMVSVVGAGRG